MRCVDAVQLSCGSGLTLRALVAPTALPPSPSLRENNTGSFPRGLSLMLRAVGAWIYDRDPLTPLQV